MAGKKTPKSKTAAGAKVIRQAPPPSDSGAPTLFYPVLSPFKFRGSPVKPGSYVELTEAEAEQYYEDDLIGEGTDQLTQEAQVAATAGQAQS